MNVPINLAPGFYSFQKINEQLYCQCFIPGNVHAGYVAYLKAGVGAACVTGGGVPQLGAQFAASNLVFVLTELRYVTYNNAVLLQCAFVPKPADGAQKARFTASTLPELEETEGPAEAPTTEGITTLFNIDTASDGIGTKDIYNSGKPHSAQP